MRNGQDIRLLGELLHLRKEVIHPRDRPNGPARFVGLEHIEPGTGRRLGELDVEKSELTGRKPAFHKGDIVYGYLRPYLNKVWVADFDGLCSVDQYVYRVHADVDVNYMAWFLRSPDFLSRAPIAGAPGQLPRIRTEEVASVPIALPALREQRTIAARMETEMAIVARARAAAEVRLEAARELVDSIRDSMLRELASQSFPRVQLAELCAIESKQVDPKRRRFGLLPHVSAENIESGTGRLLEIRSAAEDGMISGKYLFEAGEVLYSKLRPYLRKVVLASFQGICSADMYPLRVYSERLDGGFLAVVLLGREFTRYAEGESARARMPKLNRRQLMSWSLPLPNLARQKSLVSELRAREGFAWRLGDATQGEVGAMDALPAALLRRAFHGEL